MSLSALSTSFVRHPNGEFNQALARRFELLRATVTGRTPLRTALLLLGILIKVVVAALTVIFILVTVELPMLLVGAMFAVPVACAVAIAWVRAACGHRAAQRLAVERVRRLESEHERALAEARLALLMSQFDPDFLFNNLASLQFLMKRDRSQADFMLSQLVHYLRLSSPSLKCDNSTLGAQMELVDAYLQLASIRMGKRLFVQVSCPPELKGEPFPPMVLHALVENALLHGAEPCLTSVMLEVSAYMMSGRLIVDIKDDGVGLCCGPSAPGDFSTLTRSSGRGLRNVRTRLERVYGNSAQLTVVEQPGRGVLSRIEIIQPDHEATAHSKR
jgi:LytS/YehU family sensor histidine kinase